MSKPLDDPDVSQPTIPADVLAFVAEVEARTNKATPGPWKLWAGSVLADIDRTSNVDTAIPVATTSQFVDGRPRTFNASFIAHARADVPTLIAIVREQGALLKTSIMAADVAATALEMCAAENDSLRNSRTALEEQAWRISEERDALRERLAKLETAIDSALDGLYGLSFTPKVFDEIAKKRLDELKRARGT